MKARTKFLVGSGIIVVTLCMLAYVGFTQSKTYYHTISELPTLQAAALHQRMRVSGNVRAGSIAHRDGGVDFVLEEENKTLPVQLRGPRPATGHFQGRRAGARRGKSYRQRQLSGRTSSSQVRVEVSSEPHGRRWRLAARPDHERPSGAANKS